MFFTKRINDGSVPLKYKPGVIKNDEYRSKCFGYSVKIGEGIEVQTAGFNGNPKSENDFKDFFALSSLNISLGVLCIPSDGSVLISDNKTREQLGNFMFQRTLQTPNVLNGTFYGLEEFCGKPCCHSVRRFQNKNIEWLYEKYDYLSSYYILSFDFIYLPKDDWYVDEIKALFSPFPKQ